MLHWREDQTNVQDGGVPGVNLKWEGVREKVAKCLQANILTPISPNNFEEQPISQPTGSRPFSKCQIAFMSPRQGVLNNIAFAIPFEIRVSIFRHFVANDMVMRGVDRHSRRSPRTRVSVRRGASRSLATHSMPEAWVRGAILVRINSFIRGYSGVCWDLLEKMVELLRENISPLVPLRGSISASGGNYLLFVYFYVRPECSVLQTWFLYHILLVR
jgi:hypothetical protein